MALDLNIPSNQQMMQERELLDADVNFRDRLVFEAGALAIGRNRYSGSVCGPTTTMGAWHSHEHCYEGHYVSAGEVNYQVGDRLHTLSPGRFILVPPHVEHGPVRQTFPRCTLWWLQFPIAMVDRYRQQTSPIAAALAQVFEQGLITVPTSLDSVMERAMECRYRRGGLRHPWLRMALEEVLLLICEAVLVGDDVGKSMSPEICDAVQALELRVTENTPMTEIAASVGMSIRRFNDRFKEETGYTPTAYRMLQRVARAKRMIRADPSRALTDIALDLGFSSSQHFSTVFKRLVGISPKDFRPDTADLDE